MRIQGKIEFRILYVAEGIEPTFSNLEGKIPFVEMVYIEDGADHNMDVKSARAELQVHMIHSRKLRIKAMVEMEIESEKQNTWEIPIDVDSVANVYKKQCEMDMLKLRVSKKDM